MSQDRWELIKELFYQALELPPEERAAFLQRIEEAAIREEVAALLRGEEESESFLRPRWLPPLEDFEILRELGNGGVGVVYLAEQKSLKRRVAIKVMRDYLGASEQKILEFRLEPQRVASLNHPSIVPVYAVSRPEEIPYFIMEYIPGRSLKALLDGLGSAEQAEQQCAKLWPGPPSDEVYTVRVARLMAEVADALHACHEQGLLHQDMKPGNILLDLSGAPHLVDFGVARAIDRNTLTGPPIGTPYYMSPEQAHVRKPRVDARSDVYSLGVVLYEMLTLERPFERETYTQIFRAIREYDPPAVRKRNPRVHPDLQTICHQAMDKEADRRYPSAKAFAEDLRRFLDHEPTVAKPQKAVERWWRRVKRHPGRWVSGLLIALALSVGWVAAEAWAKSSRVERVLVRAEESIREAEAVGMTLLTATDLERELRQLSDRISELSQLRGALTALEDEPEHLGPAHERVVERLKHRIAERGRRILDQLTEVFQQEARLEASKGALDELAYQQGIALVTRAAELLPDREAALTKSLALIALPSISVRTAEPGAEVFLRKLDPNFGQPLGDAPGESIGKTPIREHSVLPGYYRVRVIGSGGEAEWTIRVEGAGQTIDLGEVALRPTAEVTAEMVLIPAGDFVYSAPLPPLSENGCPILSGTIPMEAFWIDRYEVTNTEYRRFVIETGHPAPAGWPRDWADNWEESWDRLPVAWVSVFDAQAYALWAGKRLPMYIEWQRSARGASGMKYPWSRILKGITSRIGPLASLIESKPWWGTGVFQGFVQTDAWSNLVANVRAGEPAYSFSPYFNSEADREEQWRVYLERTRPVDEYPLGRSESGLHQLVGNVSEWTESMAINEVAPRRWRPELGTRVVCGWSWQNQLLSLFYTDSVVSSARSAVIGFRCAKSVTSER
ncbi:MAG: SUMF1/EgtB/PvdO family nonheme iron enzyme [Planctomycetota bacterium]